MALRMIHQIKRMPSKGRYTAGKQVSRWEADSDNIDIEYKNLESQSNASTCTNCTCPLGEQKPLVIKILAITVVFGTGLVLGYLVRKTVYGRDDITLAKTPPDGASNMYSIKQDYDPHFSRVIQEDLNEVINYEDHMKVITECVHMSGVGSANKLLDYVEKKWRTFPFDDVKVKQYNVTLSYANYTNMAANQVTVQASNGTLLFQSQYNTSNTHPEYLPFSAYSPAARVTTTRIVYAHYGRRDDFETLARLNVSVAGALVVIRYGRTHPASKVRHAESRGALGVILYSDPADYANNETLPNPGTWWLANWAVQLADVRYDLAGDPLTPDYSSITGIHHLDESKGQFPKIPVQPIRYEDARYLLSDMSGDVVPNSWFGGLNITYRTGPGYTDRRPVTLQVQNILQQRLISNIVAVIQGHYESDKYVIVGAHIDSWIQGAVDAGTGYTVLQELARTFVYHIDKGWKPRRSIIFALWDASKYGHIGSYEWAQEYEKQLTAGAVAYINLDALIQGNYSFTSSASSLLQTVIMDAARSVHVNCTRVPICDTDATLMELWSQNFPYLNNTDRPRFKTLGDGSDHGVFAFRLGVPVINPQFTYNETLYPNLPTYPALGTLEDSKDYVETFVDPGYNLHITMAKVLADVILRLSDSAILPFDLRKLMEVVQTGKELLQGYSSLLETAGFDLNLLLSSIDKFCNAADQFHNKLKELDKTATSEFDLYRINNKLLTLPRAFIAEVGLPGQRHYKNVLQSPHPDDLHTDVIFPGITRIILQGNTSDTWASLGEQVSILVLSFRRATDILNDDLLSDHIL